MLIVFFKSCYLIQVRVYSSTWLVVATFMGEIANRTSGFSGANKMTSDPQVSIC